MENSEARTVSQYVAGFFKKAWLPLIVIIGLSLISVLALYIMEQVRIDNAAKATVVIEQLDALMASYASSAEGEEKNAKEKEALALADQIIAGQPNTFYAQRAMFHQASIKAQKKDFAGALTIYETLGNTTPRSFLSAISLFNASIAAEQSGDIEKAITLLSKIDSEFKELSAELPRALINLGRLQEAKKNTVAAMEFYNRLISEYPESDWTKIAKDRIIFLKIQEKL